MSLPITPLTIAATLQAAQGAASLVETGLEQGAASFARLLSPSTSAEPSRGNEAVQAGERLQQFHRDLLDLFQAAGVDTSFPIAITADSLRGLKLDSVHLDGETIQSLLDDQPALREQFRELERLLADVRSKGRQHGGLRLELDERDISFSLGAF